jgi:hypothetical protein
MKARCACVVAILFAVAPSFAGDALFAELEEVYLTVLADSVSVHDAPDRVYAVAMGESRGKYIPLPEAMWTKLAARLKAKKIDPSQLVSSTDLDWKDGQRESLIHKPTGKQAWVYSIDAITWHGGTRLRVAQSLYHGMLAAGGCTLILEKKDGTWVIVQRINPWAS